MRNLVLFLALCGVVCLSGPANATCGQQFFSTQSFVAVPTIEQLVVPHTVVTQPLIQRQRVVIQQPVAVQRQVVRQQVVRQKVVQPVVKERVVVRRQRQPLFQRRQRVVTRSVVVH